MIYHLHHLLACIITIYACIYPKLHFFICWGGTIEITGIFVNAFLISKRFNLSSTITNAFGGLMWLTFVVFRLVSLVLMFTVLLTDSYHHPNVSISHVTLPYLLVCGISAIVLFILSLFWLGKMSYRLFQIVYSSFKSSRTVHPENSDGISFLNFESEHQPPRSSHHSTSSPSHYPTFSYPASPIPEENNDEPSC